MPTPNDDVRGAAPVVPGTPVDPGRAAKLSRDFAESRANRIARNAVTSSDVLKAARNPTAMRAYRDTYGISRRRTGKVTNQRQSGRCWMFATYNVARARAMELLDVDDLELSQAFGMFYDKLEKANAFLLNVERTARLPVDDRTVAWLMGSPIGDGGEFRYAANLIAKWGLVPKDAMPETACSKSSAQMNAQLERLLRHDAARVRAMVREGAGAGELGRAREAMLAEVHRVLCCCLGEPPERFDLEVEVGKGCEVETGEIREVEPAATADGGDGEAGGAGARRILVDRGITPAEFRDRYVRFDAADYVELVSMPGEGRPFGHLFGIPLMDTVAGGERLRFLNAAPEELERAAVASLAAGVPCYMACDVMQQFGRRLEDFPGVLACDTMDVEGLFDVDLTLPRAEMIDLRETSLTHAMTFQGVELASDGTPAAWRVENSWGKDSCKDGYLVMSGEWFRTYGGDVVVERRFVDEATLALWDGLEVEDVAPWSGLGAAMSGLR